MKSESFDNCQLCGEMLLPGEPRSPSRFGGREVHLECGFRAIIGSAAHILRQCSCYVPGGERHDDEERRMTKREAARWALKVHGWVRELGSVIAAEQAKKRGREGP